MVATGLRNPHGTSVGRQRPVVEQAHRCGRGVQHQRRRLILAVLCVPPRPPRCIAFKERHRGGRGGRGGLHCHRCGIDRLGSPSVDDSSDELRLRYTDSARSSVSDASVGQTGGLRPLGSLEPFVRCRPRGSSSRSHAPRCSRVAPQAVAMPQVGAAHGATAATVSKFTGQPDRTAISYGKSPRVSNVDETFVPIPDSDVG
jgi:hypothetical protein